MRIYKKSFDVHASSHLCVIHDIHVDSSVGLVRWVFLQKKRTA